MGFIVNPIAGMGGRVGLKGTDGVLEEAIARGAKPVSPKRAVELLQELKENTHGNFIKIITCPGIMGEEEAKEASVHVEILPMEIEAKTTAEDTKRAVELLTDEKVDLIVFVGGDGTVKDILDSMKKKGVELPVLGIPSGVKMYSGVFAVNPS
ncbi:MAG: NAD(+)/NADH kinase, partial [Candidatus Bathyarchaeia archaeon]